MRALDAPAKDYRTYSYWLETCGEDLTPRPALDGPREVDVAILGAGFTGLWTAYYLLRRDPALRVALVEREIAGFGASGRNGGWCSAGFPVSPGMLERRFGRDAARATLEAMTGAVDEVGRVCREEGIDAHYVKGGALRIARGRHQLPGLARGLDAYERLGLDGRYELLDAAQVAARVRVAGALGGLYTPECAAIHPGRLVRGLARAVERRGATIYERTAVTGYTPGAAPRMHTAAGDLRASAVVLAGEAYLSQLPQLRRRLMPVYSLIVLTEPLTDAQWREIGWEGRECLSSLRLSVDYLSRTADGRILFGGRGAPYRFGSRIADAYDRHAPTHALLRTMAREWFPALRDVRFTHAWGGALGMPRDWLPTMSFDRATGIAIAGGYTGQGVATANLSGRVLADLITCTDSPLTALPPVGHDLPRWEPEPLRWLGVRYVQEGYARLDDRSALTGRPPDGTSLPERLGRH